MLDPIQQWLVIGIVVAAAIVLIYFVRLAERSRFERILAEELKAARKTSVDQSRRTLKGQIAEQMAPMLPGFRYEAADARFLGDPIDYVVFKGRSAFGNGDEDDLRELEIVLLEIKHGQSKLTPLQKAIARAVEEGRVRFEVNWVGENARVSTGARNSPGKAQVSDRITDESV